MFGPEPWSELAGRSWSYWDLWLAAAAVCDHAGSLDELEARLVDELQSHLDGRRGTESKLSHLGDLESRLQEAGLAPADLATPDALADKRMLAKAMKKVSDRWVEARAMTPAMVETPRVRLVRRARYGRWSTFPVDPELYYGSFRRHVEVKDHVSKYRSFAAVDRVEQQLRRLDRPSLAESQRLALYRAFHTAGLELADRTDDSHDNVGQLRREAWHTYLGLDWQTTGVRPEDYWADLCDLVVFEDYGLSVATTGCPSRPWQSRRCAQDIESWRSTSSGQPTAPASTNSTCASAVWRLPESTSTTNSAGLGPSSESCPVLVIADEQRRDRQCGARIETRAPFSTWPCRRWQAGLTAGEGVDMIHQAVLQQFGGHCPVTIRTTGVRAGRGTAALLDELAQSLYPIEPPTDPAGAIEPMRCFGTEPPGPDQMA